MKSATRRTVFSACLRRRSARTWSTSQHAFSRRRRPNLIRADSRKKLIRRKAKGRTIEEPPPPERTDNVINLMDALRQSLGKRAKTPNKGRRTKQSARAKPRKRRFPPSERLQDQLRPTSAKRPPALQPLPGRTCGSRSALLL